MGTPMTARSSILPLFKRRSLNHVTVVTIEPSLDGSASSFNAAGTFIGMGVAIRDGDMDFEPGNRPIEYDRQKKQPKKGKSNACIPS
ncbi:MAG TPA: hypothetical protein VFF31_31090 [Blastocatellia bacterium]|nr:hypothetical protein [Blastocatellia bacterium]